MDTLKSLVVKGLDLLHIGDNVPVVGAAIHPALLGVLGIVVLKVTGVLPVTAITAVAAVAVLTAVESALYEFLG